MRTAVLTAAALLLLAAAPPPDAHSGVEIEAQSAEYDDQAGVFRFTGDVRARGEGIVLSARMLEVDTSVKDHMYRASGQPARLEAPAGNGRRLHAQGSSIELRLSSRRLSVAGGSVRFDKVRVQAQRIVSAPGALEGSGGVRLEREGMRISGDAFAAAGVGGDAQITVTGSPAAISGGNEDAPMDATALTILLKAGESLVELSGDVAAKSGAGEFAGDLIVYNTLDNTFVATGDERKRVKMVIGGADASSPDEEEPAPESAPQE